MSRCWASTREGDRDSTRQRTLKLLVPLMRADPACINAPGTVARTAASTSVILNKPRADHPLKRHIADASPQPLTASSFPTLTRAKVWMDIGRGPGRVRAGRPPESHNHARTQEPQARSSAWDAACRRGLKDGWKVRMCGQGILRMMSRPALDGTPPRATPGPPPICRSTSASALTAFTRRCARLRVLLGLAEHRFAASEMSFALKPLGSAMASVSQ